MMAGNGGGSCCGPDQTLGCPAIETGVGEGVPVEEFEWVVGHPRGRYAPP